MSTRKEMILALTKFELQYFLDNPEWLEDNAIFFANGGFNNHTNEQLIKQCRENVWIELED